MHLKGTGTFIFHFFPSAESLTVCANTFWRDPMNYAWRGISGVKAVPSINCLFICCCDLNKKLESQYHQRHSKCQLIQSLPGSLRLNGKAWYSSDSHYWFCRREENRDVFQILIEMNSTDFSVSICQSWCYHVFHGDSTQRWPYTKNGQKLPQGKRLGSSHFSGNVSQCHWFILDLYSRSYCSWPCNNPEK